MARLSLKNILSKKNDASVLVLSFIEQMNAHISIEDEQGKFLCGNIEVLSQYQHPVKLQDEILGWVKGDEKAIYIASLLTLLAQKDFERKNLGSEVLILYQEVNMVFNFSDKLAQEVCRKVKKELNLDNVYIVLLTAKGQELDRQKGQEVGADVYMTKPFDPEAILNKAREVLGLK